MILFKIKTNHNFWYLYILWIRCQFSWWPCSNNLMNRIWFMYRGLHAQNSIRLSAGLSYKTLYTGDGKDIAETIVNTLIYRLSRDSEWINDQRDQGQSRMDNTKQSSVLVIQCIRNSNTLYYTGQPSFAPCDPCQMFEYAEKSNQQSSPKTWQLHQ